MVSPSWHKNPGALERLSKAMINGTLKIPNRTDIVVENGGLFSSRGRGSHPERVLESYELILVRRGELKLREDQNRFRLGPGDALVLFPGRCHRGIGRFPAGLQFYWVHFRITVPQDEMAAPDALLVPQHVTLDKPDHMEELFRQFLHDQESGHVRPCRASAYMLLLLTYMVPKRQKDETGRDFTQHVARVEEYITTHFHEPIHAAAIAHRFKLNVDYIGRLYKQAFGVTLTEAIRRKRLKKAREYLLHTDANMNEIASECGFGGSAYFRRSFNQAEGISPTKWRALHSTYQTNTE
jgi:AraC-like DNA-binding protein